MSIIKKSFLLLIGILNFLSNPSFALDINLGVQQKIFLPPYTPPPPPVGPPVFMLPETRPNIGSNALTFPTQTIPVFVTIFCFDAVTCPKAFENFNEVELTESYLIQTIDKTNLDFVNNGISYAKLSLIYYRKLINPAIYSGDPTAIQQIQNYFIPGYLNIFFTYSLGSNSIGGFAFQDQTLRKSGHYPLVVMRPSLTINPNLPNMVLSHEVAHVLGANHVADGFGSTKYIYKHSECGSDFEMPIANSNLPENIHLISNSYGQFVSCNNTVANLMSYGASISPSIFAPHLANCIEPTFFTDQWYYNNSQGNLSGYTKYFPATYGNALRVIFKCWNHQNFNPNQTP